MASVLVVDDDRVMRLMARRALEHAGHTVFDATDGRSALRALAHQPGISLIVTDLLMPDMDGLELLSQVRREHPEVRVVAVSGGGAFPEFDYLRMASVLGACHTVAKPFTAERLCAAVTAALPQ